MKLDLVEINKLSPIGLWDLRVLSAFISTLLRVSTGRAGLVYMHMAMRYRRQLRVRILENLNMRIKAWVMLCPNRIAWVRSIIGEAAIRRWQKNRLLDYALSKYFGDWKVKFPDGFAHRDIKHRRNSPATLLRNMRPYKWKPFALLKIENVYGFLYGKIAPGPETSEERAAYLKLWGVEIMGGDGFAKWQQARMPRALKPVEFTPYELAPKENINPEDLDSIEDGNVRKKLQPPFEPKKLGSNKVRIPEEHKPP